MPDPGWLRVGNQSASSAEPWELPFAFALQHGFDAFEWFPDPKASGAGRSASEVTPGERRELREAARAHDVRLSVHASLAASPLHPAGARLLLEELDFAAELGAGLLCTHLLLEEGAAAFARALAPLWPRLEERGLDLALENTVLTGPEEVSACFRALRVAGLPPGVRVGVCLDLGHANLCAATRNDYLAFVDRLDAEVPILHLHLHENRGDADSHLPLFTGPAARDERGLVGLLERLAARGFRGSAVLEQWPEPPSLLLAARERLLALAASVAALWSPGGVALSRGG